MGFDFTSAGDNHARSSPRALAIGGDRGFHLEVAQRLDGAGVAMAAAQDGALGLKSFYDEHPDAVILALRSGDGEGLRVLKTIREMSAVPVLAISALDSEVSRVEALHAGADDCVSNVSALEVVARLLALLRRPRRDGEWSPVLEDEFIRLDHRRHLVEVSGAEVSLTPTEFRMLAVFAENPGRALGHEQLLEMIWGDSFRGRDEVKLYVSYLRRKCADAGAVDPIETVRGVGYRYRPRRLKGPD